MVTTEDISGVVFLCNWVASKPKPSWITEFLEGHVLGSLTIDIQAPSEQIKYNTKDTNIGVPVTCFFIKKTFSSEQFQELKDYMVWISSSAPNDSGLFLQERMSYYLLHISSISTNIISQNKITHQELSNLQFPSRTAFLQGIQICLQKLCKVSILSGMLDVDLTRYKTAASTIDSLLHGSLTKESDLEHRTDTMCSGKVPDGSANSSSWFQPYARREETLSAMRTKMSTDKTYFDKVRRAFKLLHEEAGSEYRMTLAVENLPNTFNGILQRPLCEQSDDRSFPVQMLGILKELLIAAPPPGLSPSCSFYERTQAGFKAHRALFNAFQLRRMAVEQELQENEIMQHTPQLFNDHLPTLIRQKSGKQATAIQIQEFSTGLKATTSSSLTPWTASNYINPLLPLPLVLESSQLIHY